MELFAYNILGRGLDMSGFVNGTGLVVADPSVQTEFIGALDANTLAYAVYGAPWSFMTVTGTASYDYFLQQYTGDLNLTELHYLANDGLGGVSPMISMTGMNLYTNVYTLGSINVATLYTGDDWLWGNDYADVLRGGPGDDMLWGEAGNDVLDGETGADAMRGGAGNDVYYVDNPDDFTAEPMSGSADPGGVDRVYSSVTWGLSSYIENLTLTGSASTAGYGNNLRNLMTGNRGDNLLRGEGGNDVLAGGAGDDVLLGNAGADTLTGGSGTDWFVFDSALGSSNVDRITDYSHRDDWIGLDDDVFRKLPGTADGKALSAAFLRIGSAARDGNDYLIYNPANDRLYYDSDGNGARAPVLVATIPLPGNGVLAATDFLLYS